MSSFQVEAAKDAAAEMVEDQREHIGKLKQVCVCVCVCVCVHLLMQSPVFPFLYY
jgi:hypothetical protein